jgi:hypothetical protein
MNPKWKTTERGGVGTHSLTRSTRSGWGGGRGGVLEFRNGTRKNDKPYLLTRTNIQPTTSWLILNLKHVWCSDKPRATLDSQDSSRPGFGGSHHLPPYSIICASPQHLHPNGFLFRDSQGEVPKLSRFRLPLLCGVIILCPDLLLGSGLQQPCSSH